MRNIHISHTLSTLFYYCRAVFCDKNLFCLFTFLPKYSILPSEIKLITNYQ